MAIPGADMTTSRVAKVAVVTCSLLLAGGYLFYANSDALRTSSKRAHITAGEGGGPLAVEVFTPATNPAEQDLMRERAMISSSKFAAVTVPSTQDRRVMAFGSKSGAIDLTPTTQPRMMLSGSKSNQVDVVPGQEPR